MMKAAEDETRLYAELCTGRRKDHFVLKRTGAMHVAGAW